MQRRALSIVPCSLAVYLQLVACTTTYSQKSADISAAATSSSLSSSTALSKSIPLPPGETAVDIAAAIRNNSLSSTNVVKAYLARIEAYDRNGPKLQSILSLNPNAVKEAQQLDAEARQGKYRGPLHGVPVVIKDNIETRELPTTGGSLALARNSPNRDSPLVTGLRSHGAIILGKTNLSEWANFRSDHAISGWSAIGGQTRNPHSLDRSPCGSSSGSGAAMAAQLAAISVGTETNGSITCPAAMNGVVGFKPTVGLISRTHIIPISSTQDTAGPITRSVEDAALMLNAMSGTDPNDPATEDAEAHKVDYLNAAHEPIQGLRIGVLRFAQGDIPEIQKDFDSALETLNQLGVELVEIESFEPSKDFSNAILIMTTEFKVGINNYLSSTSTEVKTRSLKDLISFNLANATQEMPLFNQEIFEKSLATKGLEDPDYQKALTKIRQASREQGIDHLLKKYNVSALVSPSRPPAFLIDVAFGDNYESRNIGFDWLSAIAGYPLITVPMGSYQGLPTGLSITASAWEDVTVLKIAYSYEQASKKISKPQYYPGPFSNPTTAPALIYSPQSL